MSPPCRTPVDPEQLCQCEEGDILLNYQNRTCVPIEQCPSEYIKKLEEAVMNHRQRFVISTDRCHV